MATANNDDVGVPTQNSTYTVQSPEKEAPKNPLPKAPNLGVVRTELPRQIIRDSSAFALPTEDPALGNLKAIEVLKAEGKVGMFYPRENVVSRPTFISIAVENFRSACFRVIFAALSQQMKNMRPVENATLNVNVTQLSTDLTCGCCIALYLRLQAVNSIDTRVYTRYRERPLVPAHFEVPAPIALALTQLGRIKLSEMPEERYYSPTIPATASANFCCPADYVWKPVVYAEAQSTAKKLGLQFSPVDLTCRLGSSWWLYRPIQDGDEFRLECPFPESNFTANTTALASLFCSNEAGGFLNPIVNLPDLGTRVYASLLRYPPQDIHVNTYHAIVATSEVAYLFSD